jgi:hypothetical protein
MSMRLKQLVAWRDMLLALDMDGQLWWLRVDSVTHKGTATLIPVVEASNDAGRSS